MSTTVTTIDKMTVMYFESTDLIMVLKNTSFYLNNCN